VNERIDDLGDGFKIIQNTEAFCFGIEAVCLSNFANIKKGEKVLDLCTGNGIVPVLLCKKTEAASIIGLEIQAESVELARRSVALNKLEGRIQIDQGDVKKAAEIYPPNHFDVITVNPPYISASGGVHNKEDAKTIARHEVLCTLPDILRVSSRLLKTGGRLYMVHRPHRLVEIFCYLRRVKLEPKTMQLVQAGSGNEACEPSLVLIEAVDCGRPRLKVLPTLLL